ncbi:MAG: ImmA/IrrE family metallo-endopeptidase [Candidatus Aminicenantes bacterium]|nr:MAG: ImmA/IrrE family metallo-endopeptidase [Candidatus Aminicenantes bacterium]
MHERIPINPDVLKWARQTAGMQLNEVARKMGKDVDTIQSWEHGDTTPTYVQLEKLAYHIYKRPVALFFFPAPPQEETPRQSFRTFPDQEIEMMSPQMHYLLKQARAMQINLAELNDYVNPAKHNIVHDLKFHPDASVKTMAAQVREYLGIDLNTQFSWKDPDEALKSWRNILEVHGVFVFKEAFKDKDESFSGFCLYHQQFPLIYINNSTSKTRQIFSVFHELAHLLLGTGGVVTRNDDYIKYLKGNDRKVEILCNRFAGEFLVPDSDFSKRIAKVTISDLSVTDLADKYNVSREVILRKCLDRKLIDKDYYSKKAEEWADEARKERKRRKDTGGGDYYATKGTYLGEGYLSLAFSRYFQKKISINQLADYLGVKVKNISGMEYILFKKGLA